jgi:protein-S-isoprenylcysteine O-methyltransferase Ste14
MSSYIPHDPLHWILIAAAASVFILYGLALQHFFVQAREPSRLLRLLQDGTVLLGLVQCMGVVVLHPPSDAHAGAGIAIYSFALALFLSSVEACRRLPLPRAFVVDPRPEGLATIGPFRWIRHPFYVAYWLGFLAGPVASASLILALPLLLFTVMFIVAARDEEARLLAGPMGARYREYAERTGMFVPFVGRLRPQSAPTPPPRTGPRSAS